MTTRASDANRLNKLRTYLCLFLSLPDIFIQFLTHLLGSMSQMLLPYNKIPQDFYDNFLTSFLCH